MALLSATLLVLVPGSAITADAATGPDCGAAVLKADGSAWSCTFADDFSASQLDSTKWTPQLTSTSGFHSGSECFVDTPQNIAVTGGSLNLTLLKLKSQFTCGSGRNAYRTQYTSGMVSTYTKFTQTRGRFEFRAKFPGGTRKGLQSSLWMWPQTLDAKSWPYSGEIDLAEWYSQYDDRVVPYVHHYYDYKDPNVTSNNCIIANVADWHTYTLEWTADAITISYDGVQCIRTTAWAAYRASGYAPFDKPFMLAITQMLGIGTNKPNAWSMPTFPATLSVDYVRVWS
jgi:beta-glucanase (GH16 family)